MKMLSIKGNLFYLLFLLSSIIVFTANVQQCSAQPTGSVNLILFCVPDNIDCRTVQNEFFTEIKEDYGDQISILSIDNSERQGSLLFLKILIQYHVPFGKQLPFVVIGQRNFSGLSEISSELPKIIKQGLENGGINWPEVDGIKELITNLRNSSNSSTNHRFINNSSGFIKSQLDFFTYQFQKDIIGNQYALWVLLGLIGCTIFSGFLFLQGKNQTTSHGLILFSTVFLFLGVIVAEHLANIQSLFNDRKLTFSGDSFLTLSVLLLITLGFTWTLFALIRKSNSFNSYWFKWIPTLLIMTCLLCAGYLFSSGILQAEAACGAIGDCNAVQQSRYANLFGIFPVSLLGILGTLGITVSWFLYHFCELKIKNYFGLAFYSFSSFGTLFFIYLTFLEPFVIGATCFWCLTSAIAMGTLMLISTPIGITAWKNIR